MKHQIQSELVKICEGILNKNLSIKEWSEVESSDMFQEGNYNGGFDSIEEEFCFSYYAGDKEYWFQFPLETVAKIYSKEIVMIEVWEADL